MLLHTLVSYRQDGGEGLKQLGDQNKNMMIVFFSFEIFFDAGVGFEPTTTGL